MFCELFVLNNFAINLFLIKLQALGVFSCDFREIFKSNSFTQHIWKTACEEPYFTRVLFLSNCKKTCKSF